MNVLISLKLPIKKIDMFILNFVYKDAKYLRNMLLIEKMRTVESVETVLIKEYNL